MRILHLRQTRRFVALLVSCNRGCKFLHRLDRPVVACLQCGCLGDVGLMVDKLRPAERAPIRRTPKAARRARRVTA